MKKFIVTFSFIFAGLFTVACGSDYTPSPDTINNGVEIESVYDSQTQQNFRCITKFYEADRAAGLGLWCYEVEG